MVEEVASTSLLEFIEKVPQPLLIVTAGDPEKPGKRGGMVVVLFTQLSGDPLLVGFTSAPGRHTLKLIREYKAFAVMTVPRKLLQVALNVFGGVSGTRMDKFEAAKIVPQKGRKIVAPIIPESPLVLECELYKEIEIGDHVLVVGKVVDAYSNSKELPLVYWNSGIYELKEESWMILWRSGAMKT
ncbi:MAG: flavin reductase family protein [Acidilobaceae archaeon]